MQIMLSVNISPRKVNRYQQQSQTVDKITENLILNVKITELKHDSEKDFFAGKIRSFFHLYQKDSFCRFVPMQITHT